MQKNPKFKKVTRVNSERFSTRASVWVWSTINPIFVVPNSILRPKRPIILPSSVDHQSDQLMYFKHVNQSLRFNASDPKYFFRHRQLRKSPIFKYQYISDFYLRPLSTGIIIFVISSILLELAGFLRHDK